MRDRMIRRKYKRAVALLLAVLMLVVYMPALAFAEEAPKGTEIPEADQTGTMEFFSTMGSAKKTLEDSYAYNDQWFLMDPSVENPGLALLSMQLVASVVEHGTTGPGAEFLQKMGFGNIGFSGDKDSATYMDDVDCNYLYGTKQLSDGSTLVAVTMQSYAYDDPSKEKGWIQNFTVNGEDPAGKHSAFDQASDNVLNHVSGIAGNGDVRYWIVGQSRGGALANLLAAKLKDRLGTRNKGIYAYTFEAPSVIQPAGDEERDSIRNDYTFIHNYFCTDDIVPMVPPWGMMLYGTTHQLNTDATDAALATELAKLGSEGKVPNGYNRADARQKAEGVIAAMVSRIPTREDYSKDQVETVRLKGGFQWPVTYNYQTLFRKLMGVIFGDLLNKADLENAADSLKNATDILDLYVSGYLTEIGRLDTGTGADEFYLKTAQRMNPFLKNDLGLDLGLSDDELYALLKLAAPIIIDPDARGEASYEKRCVSSYFASVVQLPDMVFSHHFDTLVARLKTYASAAETGTENDSGNTGQGTDGPGAGDPGGTSDPNKDDPGTSKEPVQKNTSQKNTVRKKPAAAKPVPRLSVTSITVKKGKTRAIKIIGKKKGTKNKYKKTKIAKIIGKKTATTIKVKGLKKGRTTLKIRVNGKWLTLAVTVS